MSKTGFVKALKERRKKLAGLVENGEMIFFCANEENDSNFPYAQDKNFYYLSGLNIPNATIIFFKVNDSFASYLFIEREIPERVVWDGKKMSKVEAREISGIDDVAYNDEFEKFLENALTHIKKILYVNKSNNLDGNKQREKIWIKKIKKAYPFISFDDGLPIMSELRLKKDMYELTMLEKAIHITGEGLKIVNESVRPGMMEYELEALFYYNMHRQNQKFWGFKPIIASGVNAATLHYNLNNSKIQKDQLLLCDVGVQHDYYTADITRTYPVSGKFTKRQKSVYEEVLSIQKKIIKMIKPEVSLKQLNDKTNELMIDALKRLKLIKDESELRKYYMHSISHFLGMDAHDLGGRTRELEPGNVITVEPGIYIPEEGIGIRIEDDILVTEKGHKNLSIGIPKEIDDIEMIKKR